MPDLYRQGQNRPIYRAAAGLYIRTTQSIYRAAAGLYIRYRAIRATLERFTIIAARISVSFKLLLRIRRYIQYHTGAIRLRLNGFALKYRYSAGSCHTPK